MRKTEQMKKLIAIEPYMDCANMTEFRFRLGYLAEGMLKNHMKPVVRYIIDQAEIELYQKFKRGEL